MRKIAADHSDVRVAVLPSSYPQGAEKVITYNTTGRVIGEGKLPIDCGVAVVNCTTLASVARYVKTGIPLVEKCITVAGGAVAKPANVTAPIGTPVGEVFDFCGGFSGEPAEVLYGGPMMGIAVADLTLPVLKQTNGLLALSYAEASPRAATPCIRCGRCTNACPFGLAPVAIAAANDAADMETLKKLKVNLCMECGCCSYVCPAKRPLVQQNKLAKAALRSYQSKQDKKKGAEK